MKLSLQWKWFGALAALWLALLAVIYASLNLALPSYLVGKIRDDLHRDARFARQFFAEQLAAPKPPSDAINALAHTLGKETGLRVSVIAADGTMLGESEKPPDELRQIENHLQRPEVQEALRDGVGSATRHSKTVNVDLLYVAVPVRGSAGQLLGFVRVALPLDQIAETTAHVHRIVTAATLTVGLAAIPFLFWMARRVTRPINEMRQVADKVARADFSKRVTAQPGGELGDLALSLNQMAHQLESRLGELSRLENMRKDFVANVSHELRTPLSIIKGYVETLLDPHPPDAEQAKQFLQTIQRHSKRLESLIGDLLTISALESQQARLEMEDVSLRGAAEAAVGELERHAQERGVAVSVEIPAEFPVVRADAPRLHQVFFNLLDNAVKYTQRGGRVTVSAKARDGEVEVCVADNGPGIAAEHLPRIFERFYRVDKARSRELGGTGLGLSIVKHIVQAHGGRVWAESEEGKGSAFYFTLPKV